MAMSQKTLPLKDFYLAKYQDEDVSRLINRKLLIHKQLEKPSRTYVVYSDLHGSYEKYLHWLKNGLGYYRIAVSEILGAAYSEKVYHRFEALFLLINRARVNSIERYIQENNNRTYDIRDFFSESVPKKFITTLKELENVGLSKKRILEDILRILRLITRGDEHRIIKASPPHYMENILKLYFKDERKSYYSMLDGIVENDKVYYITTALLIKLTLVNMFDKHINLGDTYDRGDGSDKLIQVYRSYFGTASDSTPMHYIWGNHDILWLGASIGNPICCMTALRISMRYNNVEFLFRYGFNLDKLRNFALSNYKELPTGKYIKVKESKFWPADVAAKMTKALLILEAKLTVSCLKEVVKTKGDIDYNDSLKYYSDLLKLLPTKIKDDKNIWNEYIKEHPLYTDVYFPTVNPECPEQLTPEEQEVADDIIRQFTTLPKLQDDLKWMFTKGETYRVMDNTVYYHAALPATDDMELESVKGMKGKKLLDFIQRDLKRIAEHYEMGEHISLREKMFLWYLWCGKTSPFFCKSKMATLERAVFNKEVAAKDPLTTWKEETNPYYKFIRNDEFLNKILVEFHADKICMGHTPVKSTEQGILSDNLRAFIIDGGASSAYGDRGAVLINSPDYTYVTFHPSLEELQAAEKEDRLPNITIAPLEEMKNLTLRHVDKGFFLRTELDAINSLLDKKIDNFCNTYFY